MSLPSPEELLVQARHLATKDSPGTPEQASLRRAVSTAYYALFHLLTQDSAALLAAGDRRLERLIARAFDHQDMSRACTTFAAVGSKPDLIDALYGALSVPPELERIAQAFVALQRARHDADYSTHRGWGSLEALSEVERAEDAFQKWHDIRPARLPPRRAPPGGTTPPTPARALSPNEQEAIHLFLTWLVFQKRLQSR
jgi:hypothetical protein